MTLTELREKRTELTNQQLELEKQIKIAEEQETARLVGENWEEIENISPEIKDYILANIPHERNSCNYNSNGWSETNNRFYCKRCMLEEIFSGEHHGRFKFALDVYIGEVRA